MPERIQRKRTRGWRLPPGSICITRGTRWGNPYKIDEHTSRPQVVHLFRQHLKLMKERMPCAYEEYIAPLRGKDLACFCSLADACHGDVLLEAANE